MKNKNVIYWIPLFLIIIFGLINSRITSQNIIKNSKFTTAVVVDEYLEGRRSTRDYEYIVQKRKYKNSISEKDVLIGDKYLIIYDSLNPKNCALLLMYPIEKKYKNNNEWKYNEVPFKIDTLLIQKYVREYK
ncbi:hypothetical protein [Soonwooa purpurea]